MERRDGGQESLATASTVTAGPPRSFMISRRPKRGGGGGGGATRATYTIASLGGSVRPCRWPPPFFSGAEQRLDARYLARIGPRIESERQEMAGTAAARPIPFRFHFTATVSRRRAFPRSSRSASPPPERGQFFLKTRRETSRDVERYSCPLFRVFRVFRMGIWAANSIARGKPRRGHSSE